jgi:hypothetical protein
MPRPETPAGFVMFSGVASPRKTVRALEEATIPVGGPSRDPSTLRRGQYAGIALCGVAASLFHSLVKQAYLAQHPSTPHRGVPGFPGMRALSESGVRAGRAAGVLPNSPAGDRDSGGLRHAGHRATPSATRHTTDGVWSPPRERREAYRTLWPSG